MPMLALYMRAILTRLPRIRPSHLELKFVTLYDSANLSLSRRALVANAGVKGRPIAPLVLSAQERAYLERQVRRHRVARSLSERCRAILRCADGLPSKSVAAELGIHEHTVGKWRRRFLKDRCDGLLDEARPGRPRTINDDQVAGCGRDRANAAYDTGRRDALVDPLDGCGNWLFPHHDPPNVVGVRLAAAP